MAVLKCKMCGGNLENTGNTSVVTCEYCGTSQTVSKTRDEVISNLFNRANDLRIKCEFDRAEQTYEKILEQDNTEAEAHWGIVLCRYGIEYVNDPKTGKKIPTCHRTAYEAITTDADYIAAIDNADSEQKAFYEAEAKKIDEIQKNILSIARNEAPFDVFICYKETDENGKRTVDSTIANDIYYQLTQEGFKVFYAPITLENKLGEEYEPYIFAALNSAKVMLVIGTKPEHFGAVWVKNEWSRYLKLLKSDRSKMIIPCYRDMDAYDLPDEFAHLQSQDMSKIGFISDLVRGIKKVVDLKETDGKMSETDAKEESDLGTHALLKRAFIFLSDEDWKSANIYSEKVLDTTPECAEAYLCKLMADIKAKNEDELAKAAEPFSDNINFKKIIQFGNNSLISRISEYSNSCIYNYGLEMMNAEKYLIALSYFEKISDYRDSLDKISACKESIAEIQQECNNLWRARKQDEKIINDCFTAKEEKAIKYGKYGAIILVLGFILLFSPFLFIEIAGLAYGLLFTSIIAMAIVAPVLIGKGNRLSRKNLTEKSTKLKALNEKYAFTQVMLDNMVKKRVILRKADTEKLNVIGAVMNITALDYLKSKKLVEELPIILKETIINEEAEEIKDKFAKIGAIVEIE